MNPTHFTRLIALSLTGLLGLATVVMLLLTQADHLPDSLQNRLRLLQTYLPRAPHATAVPTPARQAPIAEVLAAIVPTLTATPSPTVTRTATVTTDREVTTIKTPTPAATPSPVPLYEPAVASRFLDGIRHEYQGWNNCGPTTLAMALSYYGRPETQAETAPMLKPDRDDKNVSPEEMAAYALSIGYEAQIITGATVELLKVLATNGIPVIVETWYIPDPNDEMGHYLLLTGYDGDTLTFHDSYKGPNQVKDVATFDALWKVFNRTAILLYPPAQAPVVTSILGPLSTPEAIRLATLQGNYTEVRVNPEDAFAWFNLGSSLTQARDYAGAVQAFDTARALGLPWRMLWYQFTPYEAYYEAGHYEEVIALTTATLEGSSNLEESLYWRGRAYAALGQGEAARRDLEAALALRSTYTAAHTALATLR